MYSDVPNQKIKFYVEDNNGVRYRCSGMFFGKLKKEEGWEFGSGPYSRLATIDLELTAYSIEVKIPNNAVFHYKRKIEALEKEVRKLKSEMEGKIWNL